MQQVTAEAIAAPQKKFGWVQITALAISSMLCIGTGLALLTRPDSLAAITVYPTWSWALPGMAIAFAGLNRKYPKPFLCVTALWAVHMVALSEEPRSILRFGALPTTEWNAALSRGRAIRIVSINCAGGNEKALAEVTPFNPDIVLVQETPSRRDVERVATAIFGNEAGSWVNFDAAIIARGRVVPIVLNPARGFFAQARVELKSGITVDVFSVHAMTPPFRLDLWNPASWQAYSENRKTQREQFGVITKQIGEIRPDAPIVCGGDFNAMQGDPVAATMSPRLRDSFGEAGRGWGNTITNDTPGLRIDQVWISEQFKATTVYAHKTVESDHRMVICDLIVK